MAQMTSVSEGRKTPRLPIHLLAASCAVAFLLLQLAVGNGAFASSSADTDSMRLAVDYWLQVQEPSGFMPYAFNFLEDAAPEAGVLSAANLTRQAGTAAVLADYLALTGDPRVAPAIQKFLMAFDRHSLPIGTSRIQRWLEATHVLSMPVGRYRIQSALMRFGLLYQTTGSGKLLSPDADYSHAYTGAAALALMAELRYSQASGDNRFAALRRAWLEGLIGLRIPGDGFRQFPTSIDSTPYFDGETWLALTEYHRSFPQDRRVRELLTDVDATLMKKYGGQFNLDFFHWGAMAAAARFGDTQDPRFLAFLKAQTKEFLRRRKDRDAGGNSCAHVEGVADAMAALVSAGERDSELFGQADRWTAAQMDKARQLQIRPGQTELQFSNARIIAPRMKEFAGSFRSGLYSADTQVDYTAHCLSAMIKLARHDISPGVSMP